MKKAGVILFLWVIALTPQFANDIVKIESLIQDACPQELQASNSNQLKSIVSRLTDKTNWYQALEASIYRSCFNEYPAWLTGHSFNLALYGVNEGLKKDTIGYMTDLMGHKTMGKDDYVKTGRLIEKLESSGVHVEYLNEIIEKGVAENYTAAAHEAFAITYLEAVNGGSSHNSAMAEAEKTIRPISGSANNNTLLSSVFPKEDPIEGTGIKQSVQERENQLELQKEIFWQNVENSIKQRPTYHVPKDPWNVDRLLSYVESWIGTPYLYGGYSRKGIDCSGFVLQIMLDQFKDAKLPRTASQLSQLGQKVSTSNLKPGDLVFFSATKESKRITHVGIYIGDDTFAHASSTRGVTKSSITKQYYVDRLVASKRLFY